MPRRLLALVAAIAMVGGALFVRSRLDQRKEDRANPPNLVCTTELAAFCHRISEEHDVNVTVEPAGQTVGRAVAQGGAGNIDGWLTAASWPEILEQRRRAKALPALFTVTMPAVLGRSRVALAVWPDRAQALGQNCPNQQVGWKCLGEVAGQDLWRNVKGGSEQWGPVKIAMGDPDERALGAIAFAAATVDYFGRSDLSTLDFEDDGFRDWVSDLKAHTPLATRSPDITTVLARGPAVADVFVGVEADVLPAVEASRRQLKPTVLYPSPVVTFDLVLAVVPGRAGERLNEIVRGAVDKHLTVKGWQAPGTAPGALPDPGVIDALRQVWKEAAG